MATAPTTSRSRSPRRCDTKSRCSSSSPMPRSSVRATPHFRPYCSTRWSVRRAPRRRSSPTSRKFTPISGPRCTERRTMGITGTHAILYTSEPEALRACLRDVFGWAHVDVHDGWLIFALPPAELGVHPAEAPAHELSFMCDDITATMADLRAKGIESTGEREARGFAVVVTRVRRGDVKVLLSQPRHATAI